MRGRWFGTLAMVVVLPGCNGDGGGLGGGLEAGERGQGDGGPVACVPGELSGEGHPAPGLLPADYADPADLEIARQGGAAVASCYLFAVVLTARAAECVCGDPPTTSAAALRLCEGGDLRAGLVAAAPECLGLWASASCAELYGPDAMPSPCGFGGRQVGELEGELQPDL